MRHRAAPALLARAEGAAGAASARAFTVSSDGAPVRLGRPDGSSLLPEELPWALGDAFDVLDEGASVGSTAWKGPTGRAHPSRAEAADLSDCAGWPDVEVEPGTLAVDPGRGRFAFSAGDPGRAVAPRSHFYQHWNIANSLLVDGDRAYTTIGESDASFVVIDISDPARPERVAWGNAGWGYGVALAEGYAHAWGRGRVTTFELPAEGELEPTQILEPSRGRPSAVRLRDGRLEAFFSTGITLLSLEDPSRPAEGEGADLPIEDAVSDAPNKGLWPLSDDLAMAPVDGWDLVRLYDVADPLAPIHLSTFLYSGKGTGVSSAVLHPDGSALYLGTTSDGLKVVDLADLEWPWAEVAYRAYDVQPDDPPQWADTTAGLTLVDGVHWETGTFGFAEPDGASPWDGRARNYVRTYDLADPLAPVLLDEWIDEGSPGGWLGSFVQADGFQVTVQWNYGLRTVRLEEDPLAFLGGYPMASQSTEIELAGDVGFITGYAGGGITALDLSDPDSPTELSYMHHGLDTYCLGVADRADGTWVYWSGKSTVPWFDVPWGTWQYTDVAVHDYSDPTAPVVAGGGEGGLHVACEVIGDLLVDGCWLRDVSDPTQPVLLENQCVGASEAAAGLGSLLVYGTSGSAMDAAGLESGEDTFAAVVYDAGIPAAPVLLSLVAVPDSIGGMLVQRTVVRGGVAYFSDSLGAAAVDLSDPRAAVLIDSVDLSADLGDPETLDVAGDFLYVQAQHWAFGVYDISEGLSSATPVGGGETHVAEITRLKGHQMLSATANGLYLTDVPRSPDTPAGPVTARWFPATAPPDDPGTCDDDDDDDPPPAPTGGCACRGSGPALGAATWGLCLAGPLIALRRRRRT